MDKRLSGLSEDQRRLLEKRLREKKKKEVLSKQSVIQANPEKRKCYPVTFNQAGMYVAEKMYENTAIYNIGGIAKVKGDFQVDLFEQAFAKVIEKQEILRTVFYEENGVTKAKVLEQVEFHVNRVNVGDDIKAFDKLVLEERNKCFDLEHEAAYRITVANMGVDEWAVVLIIHHLLSDGASTAILFREITQEYEILTGTRSPKENKLTIQYGDYALWQAEKRKNIVDTGYWTKRLENTEFQLSFFERCGKLHQMEDEVTRFDIDLDSQLTEALSNIAKQNHITLFSTLIGTLYLTLWKYTGQEELITGILTSGREVSQISELIGCFISAIPLKQKIDPDSTVKEFLTSIYKNFITDFQHKEEYMNYENDEEDYPIMFSYEEDPESEINMKGLDITFDEIPAKFCRCEVEIELNRKGDQIHGWLNYRKSLFEISYMKGFVKHYKHMLYEVCNHVNEPVRSLELLDKEERKQIEEVFNPGAGNYDKQVTITKLLAAQVAKYPDQIVLIMGDREVSYKKFDELTNQIGNYLRKQGVGAGDRVALIADRGIALIASIYGIIKSGAAYVPIDGEVPEERKKFILEDSNTKYLFTDKALELQTELGEQTKILSIEDAYKEGEKDSLEDVNDKDSLIYIMYTSGTTGTPKGVKIAHRNVVQLIKNERYYSCKQGQRFIQLCNYVFDGSVNDIFAIVLNGGCLVLVDKDVILNLPELQAIVEEKNVTGGVFTTALFHAVTEIRPEILKNFKTVVFGGENVSVNNVRKAYELTNKGELVNVYGPTETTVFSICHTVDDRIFESNSVPIGRPLYGTEIRIVNGYGNLQPVGLEGEILIGGDGVSDGYLNRPELNQEKFIQIDGKCFYRTGDLGKWTATGEIECGGRIDDQIKYRGYRIELGEIENAIRKEQGVLQAVVVFYNDKKTGAYLCSYVVTEETFILEDLKRELKEQLPPYMIPDYFVVVDEIPLTTNGKVDRKKLPLPEKRVSANYVAPVTELECIMAEVWKEVLGVDAVGVEDNFFDLGGHSIKIAKMCASIQEKAGISIPLKAVFVYSTIKELIQYLEQGETASRIEEIKKIEKADYYQTSLAQKRMFFAYEQDRNSTAYNIPFAVKIIGDVKPEKLECAIQKIVNQNEILRTRFELKNQEVVQVVEDSFDFHLDVIKGETQLDYLAKTYIQPFDLKTLPLFRFHLIEGNNGEHILFGDFHHSIFDGVSLETFVEQFSLFYRGKEIKALPIQYKDYAAWHNQFVQSEQVKKQGQYWKEQFATVPELLELPLDYQRPEKKTGAGEIVYFHVDASVTEELRKLAAKKKTTLNVILLAAYNIFLWKHTGQEDIVVGTPVAGRRQEAVQKTIGMFLNTLALRNYPRSDKKASQFIDEVKEHFIGAFENQDYPFEQLVEDIGIKRIQNRNPLFDTMFIMQNAADWRFDFGDIEISLCDMNYKASKFDMQFEVYEEDEGLRCLLAYDGSLFAESTAELWIEHFKETIKWICENEEQQMGELLFESDQENDMLAAFQDDFFE